MSPPCAQQALSALKVIIGADGTDDGKYRILLSSSHPIITDVNSLFHIVAGSVR